VDEEMGFGHIISRLCPEREITPRPQYDYSLYFNKYDGKCHEDPLVIAKMFHGYIHSFILLSFIDPFWYITIGYGNCQ
jgi:hypothetical protein